MDRLKCVCVCVCMCVCVCVCVCTITQYAKNQYKKRAHLVGEGGLTAEHEELIRHNAGEGGRRIEAEDEAQREHLHARCQDGPENAEDHALAHYA